MQQRPHPPELLAPAGSWDALIAAVEAGADAIYLGGKDFNARASAANFDRDELARAADFAHLRGVRLCVTVNTLLADDELPAAMSYVHWLYSTGIDAVIVQDLGLAQLIKATLPDFEVHGSTQMTVHSLDGVRYLERLGLDRVVLARELSLREIAHIGGEARLGIETFIHGALCISYSGQCLFSSIVGGRSGNRGRCAQPCRMPYQLFGPRGQATAPGAYLLSPRDLCLVDRLPELVAAGVSAFKIEGRLKRPEYVATVVGVYRRALDRALAGDETPVPSEDHWRLTQIFNRGFTEAHLDHNPGASLMSVERPHNRGLLVGAVTRVDRAGGWLEVKLSGPLAVGDGVELPSAGEEGEGTTISALFNAGERCERATAGETVSFAFRGLARPGAEVWKTADAGLLAEAQRVFKAGRPLRRVPLSAKVQALVDQPLKLWLADPAGHKVEAVSQVNLSAAINQPLSREVLMDKLGRLGATPYAIEHWKIELQGDVMLPLSELNDVRRRAIDALSAARLAEPARPSVAEAAFTAQLTELLARDVAPVPTAARAGVLLTVRAGGEAGTAAALQAGADRVYLDPAFPPLGGRPVVTTAEAAFASAASLRRGHDREVIVAGQRIRRGSTPPLPTGEGILARNLGDLEAALARADRGPICADFTLNLFNSQALGLLAEQGVDTVTLSIELTMAQIRALAGPASLRREALVHGSLPLMISEHCPAGAVAGNRDDFSSCGQPCRAGEFKLQDRLGHLLPLVQLPGCVTEIYNPMELCLLTDLPALLGAGITAVRIEGQRYAPDALAQVTAIYRRHLDRALADPRGYRADADDLATLAAMSPGGLTKGHYFRGVI